MSFHKLQAAVDKWTACRMETISSLRSCARELDGSHRRNAHEEHDSAILSLSGSLVGLGGVLLAPVSGGLSLGLCGLSSLVGIGSYVSKRQANQEDESVTDKVKAKCKRALDQDNEAKAKVMELCGSFEYLEEQVEIYKINDILVSIQKTSITNLDISIGNIHSSILESHLKTSGNNSNIPVLGITTQIANLNAALTSAEKVVRYTTITKEVFRGTKTIKQVVSTAKSVNDITKTAQSLATAKQTAVLSMQASQSIVKSATAFSHVARGTDGVAKTVGAVSSISLNSKRAVDMINTSGQIASIAKSVTKTAAAGKSISTLTKGADTTIKTVRNVKQASQTVKTVTQVAKDTDKAIRTTRLTTHATKISKVSQTATKAASISKVGLVINAVVIPLDVYNLVVASENLGKSHEDVKQIEDEANRLETEMKNMRAEIMIKIDTFTQLHVQLCEVYKGYHIEVIYEYLKTMHEIFEFHLPSQY